MQNSTQTKKQQWATAVDELRSNPAFSRIMQEAKEEAFQSFQNSGFWELRKWLMSWATLRAIRTIEARMTNIKQLARFEMDELTKKVDSSAAELERNKRLSEIRSKRA